MQKKIPRKKNAEKKEPDSLLNLPIPLWEEDFSEVKRRIDGLGKPGPETWRTFLEHHPEEVHSCLSLLKVRDVNPAALAMFQYDDKPSFLGNPPLPAEKEWRFAMREDLIALVEGRRAFESELTMQTFDGEPVVIRRRSYLIPGCERDWSRVIVSPVDITPYRKAERRLRTEVEWVSLLVSMYENASRLSERDLYAYVLEQAVHLTESQMGFFFLLSEDRTGVKLASWIGRPPIAKEESESFIPLDRLGIWADCIRLNRPVVVNGKSANLPMFGLPAGHASVHRFISLPVPGENGVHYAFGVANKPRSYQDRDVAHVQLVVYGLCRILRQRHTLEALTQSEELFRLLTKQFPVPIAVFNEHGRSEFLNDRFLSTFGFRLEDIPDLDSWWRRAQPDEPLRREILARWRQAEERAERDRTDIELAACPLTTADGNRRIVDVLGAAIRSKRLLLLNDVTEHIRAEEETRRRTEELEVLAKISNAMRSAESRTEIYSILVSQLSELMKADGASISLRDEESGEDTVILSSHEWKDLSLHRMRGRDDQAGVLPAGTWFWRNNGSPERASADMHELHAKIRMAHAPLIAGGRIIGTIWIGGANPIGDDDIRLLSAIGDMAATAIHRQSLHEDLRIQLNALKEAQTRLLQSEKLAAIGQLAAGIAHELNNPLTSVVLYAQLAQQENLDEAARANIEKAVTEALRASKIVRGLLDFARQRPILRTAVQVNETLRKSLDLVSYEMNSSGVKVKLDLASDVPPIPADPYQLTQVFINLIQNAVQAMSSAAGRRELRIATSCGPSHYSQHGADGARMVRIVFQDSGPGIPEETLKSVFDPFFTTKPEGNGTGLGLSICHGIVAEHEGHIGAKSVPGEGATVTVELPVSTVEEESPSAKEERAPAAPSGTASRILIIDDEPNVQDVLAKSLESRGYLVDTAGNGDEGFARLAESPYDVILCDFRMPGFSGMDFYRRLQSEKPALVPKIIFVTGDTANRATLRFVEENQLKVLEKPFELSDLLKMIRLAENRPPS